jgi:hypothetical protein
VYAYLAVTTQIPTSVCIYGDPQYTDPPPPPYSFDVSGRQVKDQIGNDLLFALSYHEFYDPSVPTGNCTSSPVVTSDGTTDANGVFGPDHYFIDSPDVPNPCSSSSTQHIQIGGWNVSPTYSVTWTYSGVTVSPINKCQ